MWVHKVARFAPALSESAQGDWDLLWTDLGIQPDVADFLSCTLQLRWEEGTLVVAEELEGADVVGLVMNTLLDFLRFNKLSDSSWLQAGDTGVQKIESVTSTVSTVGTFNVLVLRRLWTGRVIVANSGDTHDLFKTGMPQIFATSALMPIVQPDSTATGLFEIVAEIING